MLIILLYLIYLEVVFPYFGLWTLQKEDRNSIQNRRVIKGFQVYITYIDFKD